MTEVVHSHTSPKLTFDNCAAGPTSGAAVIVYVANDASTGGSFAVQIRKPSQTLVLACTEAGRDAAFCEDDADG